MQNKTQQGIKPPIPTPEQELERYGVWVKTEPQDILDELVPEEIAEELPTELSDSENANTVFLEEEEDVDFFDSIEDLPDLDELPAIDDTSIEYDESSIEEPKNLSAEETDNDFDLLADLPDLDSSFSDDISLEGSSLDEIPLDEIALDGSASASLLADDKSNISDDILEDTVFDVDLDDLEPFSEDEHKTPEETNKTIHEDSSSDFDATEISVEEFGLEDSTSSINLEDFSNVEEDFGLHDNKPDQDKQEFEKLDLDLSFEDTIPQSDSIAAIHSTSETEVFTGEDSDFEAIDIDDFNDVALPDNTISKDTVEQQDIAEIDISSFMDEENIKDDNLKIDTGNSKDEATHTSLDSFIDLDTDDSESVIPSMEIEDVSLDGETFSKTEIFDDVKALENDLLDTREKPSNDLLLKIASELASIKDELVSLRSQLSSLKASSAASPEIMEENLFEEEEADNDAASGGFFDDEEDDTIALTGDELDNILNSADFTEESLDTPVFDLEDESEVLESGEAGSELVTDLLPEDGVYEAGIETIELPTQQVTDTEKKAMASVEEMVPLTDAPEDTSFLDAEYSELEEFDSDLLEEPLLVEPDSADLGIIIDSAFGDEEEDLPFIEPVNEDIELPVKEEPEPEIVLDIEAEAKAEDSQSESFPDLIEEEDSFELEELTEPEELGGMELHTEVKAESLKAQEEPHYGPEASLDSLEDLEELADELSIDNSNSIVIPETHPDDYGNSLDDSFFVGDSSKGSSSERNRAEQNTLAEENLISTDTIANDFLSAEPGADDLLEYADEDIEVLDTEVEASENAINGLPDYQIDQPFNEKLSELTEQEFTEPEQNANIKAESEEPKTHAQAPITEALDSSANKLKHDVKAVLLYLDHLLASLPEEKIEEFASSEYYDTYKKLFDELGLL